MLKLPITLRRSKESTSGEEEEALIVSPPSGGITTPRGGGGRTTPRTPRNEEALAKWEQKLGAEGGAEALAQPLQSPRCGGSLVSPRWVDDHAGPTVQKNRSHAQVGAMAALYATNPHTFDS
jgi:hypothetical protein